MFSTWLFSHICYIFSNRRWTNTTTSKQLVSTRPWLTQSQNSW
jgi:hypothetical protein